MAISIAMVIVGVGCAPAPPPAPAPSLHASVTMTAPEALVPGVVELGGVASGFPSGNGYDVSWTATDLHTGEVVYDEPDGYGNGDGVLFDVIQAGLFDADVSGSTASIEVGLSVTAERGGVSVTDTASATLSWTMPSSPITGSMTAPAPTYQVISYHSTVCAPVGTTLTFAISERRSILSCSSPTLYRTTRNSHLSDHRTRSSSRPRPCAGLPLWHVLISEVNSPARRTSRSPGESFRCGSSNAMFWSSDRGGSIPGWCPLHGALSTSSRSHGWRRSHRRGWSRTVVFTRRRTRECHGVCDFGCSFRCRTPDLGWVARQRDRNTFPGSPQ